jgi:GH24 family phage-related lysozyme (muramidase)
MKQILAEELKRMHTIIYGEQIVEQEDFISGFLKSIGFEKKDDPEKADLVDKDVEAFFDTLKSAADGGGISEQKTGGMEYQKDVESMQIGLTLLGYDLPRFGVDGLFGPETANAVQEFIEDNLGEEIDDEGTTTATPEMLDKLIDLLKQKGVTSDDLKNLVDPLVGSGNISLSGDWLEMAKQLIRKFESFSPKASWDENAFRGGYGSGKKLVNGKLEKVTANTTWTQQEAEDTLDYELKNTYGPIVANQLGMSNWGKLNDKQKASLVSLGYNAGPYYLSARDYGKNIKNAIEDGDMEAAAAYIASGPTTGASSGRSYSGLQRRRAFESEVFLS